MRTWTLLLLVGCITETGNPELDAELAVRARSTDPSIAQLARAPSWRVEQAWVGLDEPRFVTAESCDTPDEVETDLPAPGEVDLLASEPFVVRGTLPADAFCRFRLRLARGEASGVLGDDSVYLAGVLADGRAFEVRSSIEPELDLRSRAEPVDLGAASGAFVLAFDVARWLEDVDADRLEADPDGVVRIDEDHDDEPLQAFEDALEASLELFEDLDGDGDAGPDDVSIAAP
jgi:hypothetical protein